MLTIISVSYKSKSLLEMNYRLVKILNPNTTFRWLVVQNTPSADMENDLAMDDPRFEMIPGVPLTKGEEESIYYTSFHHAKALNLAISYTDSDLILTLDPDCFLFMPNWIELTVQHMIKEKIVFFGVPYPPFYFMHYQGFPTAICMFINRCLLHRKDRFILDFTPVAEKKLFRKAVFSAISYHCSNSFKHLLFFFFKARRQSPLSLWDFPLLLRECIRKQFPRLFKESSYDTGYQIYKRYRSSMKYETLQVFGIDKRSLAIKLLESMLPNSRCTSPQGALWITTTSSLKLMEFTDRGYQFFWNDKLFAFHIQGSRHSEKKKAELQNRFFEKLEEFMTDYQVNKNYTETN